MTEAQHAKKPTPSPPPDAVTWWDYWNTSYRRDDGVDDVSSELFERVALTVRRLAGDRGRILEVACGTGTLSRLLALSHYHGLDISPSAIEIAREKSLPQDGGTVLYEAADFLQWNAPVEPFDVVVCVDAIAYFSDQRRALSKMAESVRPGGHLLLTTINPFVYRRIRRTATVQFKEGPVSRWLTRKELKDLIAAAGLVPLEMETIIPRGNLGILRIVNSPRLNQAFGSAVAARLRRFKEVLGLGQYHLVVASRPAS